MIIMIILAVVWYFILGIVIASLAARFGSDDFQVREQYGNGVNPLPVIIFLCWPVAILVLAIILAGLGAMAAIEKLSGKPG